MVLCTRKPSMHNARINIECKLNHVTLSNTKVEGTK